MKQKLIKISDSHYIVVDDSDIKEGDWVIDKHKSIYQQLSDKVFEKFTGAKKITYSTQPLNKQFNDWFDVKIIPLSEVEEAIYGYSVEKMADECSKQGSWQCPVSYVTGFNAHKELVKDKLFTVEDMINAHYNGWIDRGESKETPYPKARNTFKQSLLPKTEWDVEFDEQGKLKLVK